MFENKIRQEERITKMKYLILFLITNVFQQNFSKERFFELLDKNHKARFYVVIPYQRNKVPNHYYLTTNDKLYQYYLKTGNKNAVNYKDFLNKLFAEKIPLVDLRMNNKYVSLTKENVAVNKEFQKYGLKYIRDKYLQSLGDEWRNKLSDTYINNTVVKIMVNNGYIVYFSEYSGYYSFKEIGSL